MKQPNPQAEEAQVKAIFGPENQFVNWVGTLQFFCLPDNRRSALHSRLRRQPRALSLAAASSSNIRATVTAQVVPFSGLTKLNNILRAVNRPPTTTPMEKAESRAGKRPHPWKSLSGVISEPLILRTAG
jgi:hypothetical protein